MNKIKVLMTAAVICMLAGCSSKEPAATSTSTSASADTQTGSETQAPAAAAEGEELFTCLISEAPAGVPFTDLTWTGFERIEQEYGAQVKLIEALDKAEYSEQIRAMAEMGANPIYTMFDTVNEVAIELAPEYPDTKFCLIDSNLDTKYDNVANVYVDSLEPAFVSGFVASKTTESGTVGWIGSLDIPVINRFRDAYLAGAVYGNPEVVVKTAYVGDDSDTVKAGEQTKIMVSQGADVIFQTANLAGLGVISACGEAGIKCIGVDEWQGDIDDCVFWSSLTDISGAVFDSFTSYKDGKFIPGKTNYGIETQSAIFDTRDYDKLPDEVKKQLDKLIADVKSGSLKLEELLK
ncbi:BMP family ABC transporter substrate-binding protein [Hungatella effluvii]|uniref:BMP family ABC transporter substrate-binding protein n=1 Tax=Hungatella effluvii TaxID=1096246 RepID=UPI0022E6DD7B|nr:BMP family ABC transporter substrate-binding protein [Hungatella effluvii]